MHISAIFMKISAISVLEESAIFLLSFTYNNVVSVQRGFLILLVL